MAREASITQEQVNAAADAIRAAGEKPTARAVREQLGTGSMATVLKLWQNWQGRQIKPAEQALVLPPALQRALVDCIGQEVSAARAGLEADLVTAQLAEADLIKESERQATTIELQAEALQAAQETQAAQAGRMGQLEVDLAKALGEAQQERQTAELVRTELAKIQLRLEAMPKLEAEIAELRAELAAEHLARTAAEQTAAVVTARLEASERRAGEIEAQRKQGETRIADLVKAGETAAADAKKSAQELATANGATKTLEAKLDAATRELEAAKTAVSAAQNVAKKAGEEAAELRGQIKAAQDAVAKAAKSK